MPQEQHTDWNDVAHNDDEHDDIGLSPSPSPPPASPVNSTSNNNNNNPHHHVENMESDDNDDDNVDDGLSASPSPESAEEADAREMKGRNKGRWKKQQMGKRQRDENRAYTSRSMTKRRRKSGIPDASTSPDPTAIATATCSSSASIHNGPVSGVIEWIKLDNFMCHNNLEVELGPQVNVIHGANGSGKSAILTAMMVCLGAKAMAARGASRLRDLIKHGERQAHVTIRLRNIGADAFRPETYGTSILIRKTITANGGSSIKINAHDGSRVSIKSPSSELRAICDRFNIQIDSPSTAMTQENAKFFLADSNKRQKYDFFHNTTQLQSMVDGFVRVRSNSESLHQAIDSKKDTMQGEKRKMVMAQMELEEAENLKRIGKRLETVRQQLAWAIVRDKHREIEKDTTTLAQVERKMEKVKTDMVHKFGDCDATEESASQTHEKELERLYKKRDELNAYLAEHKDDQHELQQAKLKIETETKKALTVQDEIRKQIQSMRVNTERHNREIEKLQSDNSQELNSEREKLDGKLMDLKARLEAMEQQIKDKAEELKLTKEKHHDLKSIENQLQEQKLQRVDKINRSKQQIQSLEDQKKEKFTIYGRNMLLLLRKIEQNKDKFDRVPIGPIGSIITVKHTKWAAAVEKIIGGSLRRFVCHSLHDEKLLRRLAASVNVPNAVVVQNFSTERYAMRLIMQHKPHQDFLTVYDQIIIDYNLLANHPVKYFHGNEQQQQQDDLHDMIDATVMNVLTDWHNVESVILIEGRMRAKEIMFPSPPPKVKSCYTETGTRLIVMGRSQVENGAHYKARILAQTDIDTQIEEHKSQEQAERSEVARLEVEITQSSRDAKALENQARLLYANYKTLTREKQKVETEIEECEEQLENLKDDSTNEIKITHEREMIEYLNGKITHENERYNEKAKIVVEQEKKKEEVSKELEELTLKMEMVQKEIDQVEMLVKDLDKQQAVMNHQRNLLVRELRKREGERDMLQKKLETMQTELAEAEDTASRYDRVDTETPVLELLDLRRKLEKNHEAAARAFGGRDFATIEDQFQKIKANYTKKMTNVQFSKDIEDHIRKSLKSRTQCYAMLLNDVSSITAKEFNMFLNHRHYSGSLNFDHEERTLDVHVNAGDLHNDRTARSLSGGEKSFAMVSLLMALWSTVENPFRAMDETDVFMDDMHRKTAMNLLIETSLTRFSNRQLILFTPQNVSHLQERDGLNVLRLRPPDRRTMKQRNNNDRSSNGNNNNNDQTNL